MAETSTFGPMETKIVLVLFNRGGNEFSFLHSGFGAFAVQSVGLSAMMPYDSSKGRLMEAFVNECDYEYVFKRIDDLPSCYEQTHVDAIGLYATKAT